jgi:type VI protein secretion system component VasK
MEVRRPDVSGGDRRGADSARTVIRPPDPLPREGALAAAAGPRLELGQSAARAPRPDAAALVAEAWRLAEAFEAEMLRAGIARAAVVDARDALLAVLDARANGNPALDRRAWARARRRTLPRTADLSAETLRRRAAAAEAAGPAQRQLARFLRHCREAVEAAPPPTASTAPRWGMIVAVLLAAGLVGWGGWAEWRFRSRLLARLPSEQSVLQAGTAGPVAAGSALDTLAAAAAEVAARASASPLGLVEHLGPLGPEAAAKARYAAAVGALLPGPLAEAIGAALGTEGGSLELYDTLRSVAILEGEAPWQPEFLAGWLEARSAADPALAGLARHAAALSAPPPGLSRQDPELLVQAREIAAEGDPAAFAFLELARAEPVRELPDWSPDAVPGLGEVVISRSARPLDHAIPGRFTVEGWAYASGGGAADAVARVAEQGGRVLERPLGAVSEAEVMAELQARTLEAWSAYLADLRVRPFVDRQASVLISGRLARSHSPLEGLLREVWRQVGGADRSRGHDNQLRASATFGPMIRFVEQGRMAEISRIFAELNVALAASGDDEAGRRGLRSVAARAASVRTLQQAPRLVVQIVEDVIAQALAGSRELDRPPATRLWERELAAACNAALAGYPFAPGPDADMARAAALLAPGGQVARFFEAYLRPLMDVRESPWRWNPDARLSGFRPESAAFFERAAALGDALFPPGGVQLGFATIAQAFAQKEAPSVRLGGLAAPASDARTPLVWPGRDPGEGLRIHTGPGAASVWPGEWGLLHFLDAARLRPRDGGQRFRLDVGTGPSRIYFELVFTRPANPASARALLSGLSCPPAL